MYYLKYLLLFTGNIPVYILQVPDPCTRYQNLGTRHISQELDRCIFLKILYISGNIPIVFTVQELCITITKPTLRITGT